MAFCTKCGTEKTNERCPNCDVKQLTAEDIKSKVKRPTNKRKKKWLAGILLFVLITIGGGYLFANQYYASSNVVDRIVDAIEDEDVDALRAYIIGDSEELSDKALEHFVEIMNERNRLSDFREDMQLYVEGREDHLGHYPAVIKQRGSQLGIFDEYGLVFTDYHIEVKHRLKDEGVEIYYNDELVGVFEEYERLIRFDRIFPADGTITLQYSGGYGEVEETVEIKDIDDLYSDQQLSYYWDYEGTYLSISSNHSNSYLLVNGERKNRSIQGTLEYGPVNFDEVETIQAYAQGQFDILYSNKIEIDPDVESYELKFEEETIERVPAEELYETINLHVQEWVEAYKTQNIGYFTLLTGDYADDYLTRTENNFDEQQDQGWRYQGRIERIDYDAASVEVITAEEDRIEVSIDARLNFRSSFYEIGTDPSNTPLTNSVSEWTYHLVYDEDYGIWLIDGQEELDGWYPEEEYRYNF